MDWVFRNLSDAPFSADPGEVQVRPRPGLANEETGLALLVLDQGPDVLVRGPGPVQKLVLDVQAGLDEFLAAEIAQAFLTGKDLAVGYRKWAQLAARFKEGNKVSRLPLEQSPEGLFLGCRCLAGADPLLPAVRDQLLASWRELAALIQDAAAAGKDPERDPLPVFQGELKKVQEFLERDRQAFHQDLGRGEWWDVNLPPEETAGKAVLLRAPAARLFRQWAQDQTGGKPLVLTLVQAGPAEWVAQTDPSKSLPLLGEALDRAETSAGGGNAGWKRVRGTFLTSPSGGTRVQDREVINQVKSWARAAGPGSVRGRLARSLWTAAFLLALGATIFLAGWWYQSSRTNAMERGLVFRPEVSQKPGTLHVLTIGVSKYKDSSLNLEVADKDARDMADTLQAQQGKVFQEVKTKVLTNGDACKHDIVNALNKIVANAKEEDFILISFSGHADTEKKGKYFFFLPHDYQVFGTSRHALYWAEIKQALDYRACPALLILDTCHSGAATVDIPKGTPDEKAKEFFIITACKGRETAKERAEWGNGALTLAILEAIEGKHRYKGQTETNIPPSGSRKEVTLLDLAYYVSYRVDELTRQSPVSNNSGDLALHKIFISRRE